MAKRVIGLDIGKSHFHAVQAGLRRGRLRVEKIFCRPMRRSDDSPEKWLRALSAEFGFDRQAPMTISAPSESVFIHQVECDPSHPEQVRQALKQALLESMPIAVETVAADVSPAGCLNGRRRAAMVVAAHQPACQRRQDMVRSQGRTCNRMDSIIFALMAVANHASAAAVDEDCLLVYLEEQHLVAGVLRAGQLLLSRNMPYTAVAGAEEQNSVAGRLGLEVELTWRRVHRRPLPAGTPIYMAACDAEREHLLERVVDQLKGLRRPLDPPAEVAGNGERPLHSHVAVALGLTLRSLSPQTYPGVNLLKDSLQPPRAFAGWRSQKVLALGLGAAIAAAWVLGLGYRWYKGESRYRQLQRDMAAVFQEALPREACLRPVEQLQEQLRALQREYSLLAPSPAADPVDIMMVLARHTPPDLTITVEKITLDENRLTITALGPTFRSPYEWRQVLREAAGFAQTAVSSGPQLLEDQKKVRFTLDVMLTEQP